MDELPESDRLLDFPHPREQSALIGHQVAEQHLVQSYLSGRFHHAWIIGGTKGVGKATLAYRLTRFVLKHPDPQGAGARGAQSLFVAADEPVFRRVASGGHSDVIVARRAYDPKRKRLRSEISAETIRKTTHFLTRTAGEGGWRVCIVDAVDDMNKTAANALLKMLEEPPERALFILVAHAPGRLMPTIRSRCVRIGLGGLAPPDLETVLKQHVADATLPPIDDLAAFSRGSPGRALALLQGRGWSNFQEFMQLMESLPAIDHKSSISLAERIGARGAEEEFHLFFELLADWLAGHIRQSAIGGNRTNLANGAQWTARAMPENRLGAWSEAWSQIAHSIARTNALNLDRKQTVLQAIDTIEQAAAMR